MNQQQKTLEALRDIFPEVVLSDPKVLSLYLAASQHDDELYCPTQYGNLFMFLEVMGDEWLAEEWEGFENSEMDFSMEEMIDLVKVHIVEYLKDCINSEQLLDTV